MEMERRKGWDRVIFFVERQGHLLQTPVIGEANKTPIKKIFTKLSYKIQKRGGKRGRTEENRAGDEKIKPFRRLEKEAPRQRARRTW
jgi:hypothetical protein